MKAIHRLQDGGAGPARPRTIVGHRRSRSAAVRPRGRRPRARRRAAAPVTDDRRRVPVLQQVHASLSATARTATARVAKSGAPRTLAIRKRAFSSAPNAPVDDDVAAALERGRMRLLENDVADAEQRRHHGDAEAEAARPAPPSAIGRVASDRSASRRITCVTTRPLFIARWRRRARATAGLCVTTTIAVPSACTRSNSAGDLLAGVFVELAGRLVGEQQRRPVRQRARDRDALHLAAGQLRRPVIAALPARPT